MQTGGALLHLLVASLPLPLQLPLQLLQVGLQLCDAFTQTVLVQQAVGVLQLQAVSTAQSLAARRNRCKVRSRCCSWTVEVSVCPSGEDQRKDYGGGDLSAHPGSVRGSELNPD